MSRDERLSHYSENERFLIGKLEEIATGRSGEGSHVDLMMVRDIAHECLHQLGWPSHFEPNAAQLSLNA